MIGIILTGIVILFSSFLHGALGFAFVLIAVPLLSLFHDIKFAVPLVSLLFALLTGIMAFRLRKRFDYKSMTPFIVSAFVGMPIGIFFLQSFSDRIIKTTLGFVIVLYSLYSLFAKRVSFSLPGWAKYLFGFFSGVLGGAFNMTGPPLVFYLSTLERPKMDIVGSLSFFFFVTSILVIMFHIALGNVTTGLIFAFLALIPVSIAGTFLGMHVLGKMKEENYRKGLFYLLALMGLVLLI